jgi:S-adenosylmethionine-diacylglycerol 3-amino-3-carboxypropyl transferase
MKERQLRYGQCWEDADALLAGLDPQPGATVLSIASGGENSLALLLRPEVRVMAIDRSPPQLAALELKVAAFRLLSHPELLVLLGAHAGPAARRQLLYARCSGDLSPSARAFWEADPAWLSWGVLPVARFERYLALFRRLVLPLVHGSRRRSELLLPRTPAERQEWYDARWDGWRWRLLFRLFFNRASLGTLGTDPSFVRYGHDSQAEQLLAQVRRVMVEDDPLRNPYLHWILFGRYGNALPLALRPESFALIRSRLDQLSWRLLSLEEWLDTDESGREGAKDGAQSTPRIDGFNLSNVLEYVEAPVAGRLLDRLHRRARPGARLVLWNRLAERDTALATAGRWRALEDLAASLHHRDRVPFYRRLVVAEAVPGRAPGVPVLASAAHPLLRHG